MSPAYTVLADEPSLEERLHDGQDLIEGCRRLQAKMKGMAPSEVAMAMVGVIREAGCESKLL